MNEDVCVVKGQISGKGGPRLRHACVGVQVDLFVFDGPPQPLDEDVVAPCALAVHGDGDFGVLQHLDEVDAGELAALDALLFVKQRCVSG